MKPGQAFHWLLRYLSPSILRVVPIYSAADCSGLWSLKLAGGHHRSQVGTPDYRHRRRLPSLALYSNIITDFTPLAVLTQWVKLARFDHSMTDWLPRSVLFHPAPELSLIIQLLIGSR